MMLKSSSDFVLCLWWSTAHFFTKNKFCACSGDIQNVLVQRITCRCVNFANNVIRNIDITCFFQLKVALSSTDNSEFSL
jgi:hypothetical protein